MPEMKNKSFGAKTAVRRLNAQAAEAAYTHTDTHYPQEHTGKPKKNKKKTQRPSLIYHWSRRMLRLNRLFWNCSSV